MKETVDDRITLAREYLDEAQRQKVSELPPSILVRECAELRRQLAQALAASDQAPAVLAGNYDLTPAQLATALDGLGDAADLLEHRAAQWCGDCETAPAECCEEHLADLDAASRYRELAREIGGQR